MENIFSPEKMGIFGEKVDKKFSDLSATTFFCAGGGSLLLAAALKLAGRNQASSFFGNSAIPLLAIACYKKASGSSASKSNSSDTEKEKGYLSDNDPIAST